MTRDPLSTRLIEEQQLQLTQFNNHTAWRIGCALKEAAESRSAAVAIEVYGFGQVLFSYAMSGTAPDNLDWIRRKRQAVIRFGHSSFYLSQYNAAKQRDFENQSHIDAQQYCAHGGAFPIRVKGCGVVGVATVSGLPQEDDHNLVIDVLRNFVET